MWDVIAMVQLQVCQQLDLAAVAEPHMSVRAPEGYGGGGQCIPPCGGLGMQRSCPGGCCSAGNTPDPR